MSEQWLPIPGYEGIYEVSDLGRVRSQTRMQAIPYEDGTVRHRRIVGRVLRQHLNASNGRPQIDLVDSAGRRRCIKVHRLVALAFHGPCPGDEYEVCHVDGDRANNAASNVRWDTRKANAADKLLHGTDRFASRSRCSKGHLYTEENTYRPPSNPTHRKCRTCARDRRGGMGDG